jgi:hypothetical protein
MMPIIPISRRISRPRVTPPVPLEKSEAVTSRHVDLTLMVGETEQITFSDHYSASTSRSIDKLQIAPEVRVTTAPRRVIAFLTAIPFANPAPLG